MVESMAPLLNPAFAELDGRQREISGRVAETNCILCLTRLRYLLVLNVERPIGWRGGRPSRIGPASLTSACC
jgi:hypothetical protein